MKIYMAHPTSEMRVQNRNAYSLTLVIITRCVYFVSLLDTVIQPCRVFFHDRFETSRVSFVASSYTPDT